MKNLLKIYGKYIAVTWGVILLLLAGNIGVMFYIVVQLQRDNISLVGLGDLETELFEENENNAVLKMQPDGEELLRERGYVFLFVLDDEGNVIYDWQCPDSFPDHYSSGEIAAFSKWYLQDYPVRVWRSKYGLLVAGYEKNSIWKYTVEFSMEFMDKLGEFFAIAFWINLFIILFVIGYLGYRFYLSLQPFTEGVKKLSQNRKIHLAEKGTMSELAVQLNQTSDMLERQRTSLEQRDSARTEWIAGVSHDIRTPLSIIVGYADELENNETLDFEGRKKAEAIKIQSMKIRQLIEDLNLTSKLEYHMQPLRVKEFYPAALLRSLVAETLNEGDDERYEITLSLDHSFSEIRMRGDEELIARAVRNLIQNSIRHNSRGCHIEVTGTVSANGIIMAVSDTGIGIPKAVIEALEEGKEVQYDQKKPHIMGLRIAKQIVLAHKGDFAITREGHLVSMRFPSAEL